MDDPTAEQPWSISDVRDANGELHVCDYWIDEQARLSIPRPQLTDEQLAEWQRRFEEANTPAAMRSAWKQQLRESLPRRVRARLWLDMRIDDVAIWLCDHGHERACVALWRVTGLWS